MRYSYQTKDTCSTQISFDLDGELIRNVKFENGCEGNLQALERLVEGLRIDQVEEKLSGIRCGKRPTSCADQLCKGIRMAYEKARESQSDA